MRPFDNYIIFFFHLSLSFQSSSINPFSSISPLIPSALVSFGLPRFLLPGGLHFITFYGSLPSSIRWTCPYHLSCLVLIPSKIDLVTFIFCLIILFLILSFLEIRAERRQKSISVEFSFAPVLMLYIYIYIEFTAYRSTTCFGLLQWSSSGWDWKT